MTNKQKIRFLSSIAITNEKDCWIWLKGKCKNGYGRLKLNGKDFKAHRISYEMHNNKSTVGFQVLHKCDNPSCVNPHHLFLGTNQDNMTDKVNKGRWIGNTKMDDKQVKDIFNLYQIEKLSQQAIANIYNISQTGISRIIRQEMLNN